MAQLPSGVIPELGYGAMREMPAIILDDFMMAPGEADSVCALVQFNGDYGIGTL